MAFRSPPAGSGNGCLWPAGLPSRRLRTRSSEGKQLRRNMADRKQAEEALTFLANASTTLAALADRESALQQAARLPIPFLADWCVVYVIDEHGAIDYHAHAHRRSGARTSCWPRC